MTNQQLDSLVVGSIVRRPHKAKGRGCPYRVVRSVSHLKRDKIKLRAGQLFAVSFTMQGHSWTRRSYVVYLRSDLRTWGYVGTGARMSMRSKIDRRLAKMLAANSGSLESWGVKPSEVKGLVY